MRAVLTNLWTFLTVFLGAMTKGAEAVDALADFGKESAEELRDEARVERKKRLQAIANRTDVVAEQ